MGVSEHGAKGCRFLEFSWRIKEDIEEEGVLLFHVGENLFRVAHLRIERLPDDVLDPDYTRSSGGRDVKMGARNSTIDGSKKGHEMESTVKAQPESYKRLDTGDGVLGTAGASLATLQQAAAEATVNGSSSAPLRTQIGAPEQGQGDYLYHEAQDPSGQADPVPTPGPSTPQGLWVAQAVYPPNVKTDKGSDAERDQRNEPLGADGGTVHPVAAGEPVGTAESEDNHRSLIGPSRVDLIYKPQVPRAVALGSTYLSHWWTLWYVQRDPNHHWEENLREVTSFQTLEEFWLLHTIIEPASNLQRFCAYALFRSGIKPSRQDPRNQFGGRWHFFVDRRRIELDIAWLDILECLVTEEFGEHSRNLCGALVQVRSCEDKITVWTTDSRDHVANIAIGRKLEEKLMLQPRSLEYSTNSCNEVD